MPRFKIVSIIPGMENFAPERTETRSGFFGSPKPFFMIFWSLFHGLFCWASSSLGSFLFVGVIVAADIGW